MIPKNKKLFADLDAVERIFLAEDEYPWEALRRLAEFFEGFTSDGIPWPESMPPYTEVNADADHHVSEIIGSFGTSGIRGGWDIGTDENVFLRGPVYVGRNVKLRKGAVITGPCFIGDGVIIGQGCRVKHAVIRRGAEIQFGTRAANCVIGAHVFIGAGAVLNDRQLNGKSVVYRRRPALYGGELDTKCNKLGLMAGDGCQIGGGAVFVPGVVLGREVTVAEGIRLRDQGYYESNCGPEEDDASFIPVCDSPI